MRFSIRTYSVGENAGGDSRGAPGALAAGGAVGRAADHLPQEDAKITREWLAC